MTEPILSITKWKSNAHLIADCARLGYLRDEWKTLDPTYGLGTFWQEWRPDILIGTDLVPAKGYRQWAGESVDFTALPFEDRSFDCVVFDPPYKLNGTPDQEIDERYGVHQPTNWRERMALCRAGISGCARVLGGGYLLVKCQDQVCSGKVRWQTFEFTKHAESLGLGLVDRFEFLSYRKQDPNRTKKHQACKGAGCSDCTEGRVPVVQAHAHSNSSTLLVFKRGHVSSDLA